MTMLHTKYEKCLQLAEDLKRCSTYEQKIERLLKEKKGPILFTDLEKQVIFLSLLVLEESPPHPSEAVEELIEKLLPVERFYADCGGLIGYHALLFNLLQKKDEKIPPHEYHAPPGIDISIESAEICRYTYEGLLSLELMGEIYPVGGAADRLGLRDAKGNPLPAASLEFMGFSLLEGMVRDLEAKEYLYYKVFGKRVCTPIALMTSVLEENHPKIVELLEKKNWFGRGRENFFLFCQPAVPVVTKEGAWCKRGPLDPLWRPGGHGVIWKLAKSEGVFSWFRSKGKTKALIRQINNPIAGVDRSLLTFTGLGIAKGKAFGFASCPRKVRASEGMNVITEEKKGEQFCYSLTNLEYCDFAKYGIVDEPAEKGSHYSKFPSNTNLLFIDFTAIEEAIQTLPIPGMLVNVKETRFLTHEGKEKKEEVARLESTMQNIADALYVTTDHHLEDEEVDLPVFLTYNERGKTISTIKRSKAPGVAQLETPEGALSDAMHNARHLLKENCQFRFQGHKPIYFQYHPALGPHYSIIAQKMRKGEIHELSALILEIAELKLSSLYLDGALTISCERPLSYSGKGGGVAILENVRIKNRGLDWEKSAPIWKRKLVYKEHCSIEIMEGGVFVAKDVTINGPLHLVVPPFTKIAAIQSGDRVIFKEEKIAQDFLGWKYFSTPEGNIEIN